MCNVKNCEYAEEKYEEKVGIHRQNIQLRTKGTNCLATSLATSEGRLNGANRSLNRWTIWNVVRFHLQAPLF